MVTGGCPGHHKMFSSLPGLYARHVDGTLHVSQPKCLQTLLTSLWWGESPPVQNFWSNLIAHPPQLLPCLVLLESTLDYLQCWRTHSFSSLENTNIGKLSLRMNLNVSLSFLPSRGPSLPCPVALTLPQVFTDTIVPALILQYTRYFLCHQHFLKCNDCSSPPQSDRDGGAEADPKLITSLDHPPRKLSFDQRIC